MKLADRLKKLGIGYGAYGKRIGVKSPETVRRYCLPADHKDHRIPRQSVMVRIAAESGGLVPPESFYPGYQADEQPAPYTGPLNLAVQP